MDTPTQTPEKKERDIWSPLGGFKRGMGFLSFIVLVAAYFLQLPNTTELQALLTAVIAASIGGNVLAGKK
jgi:hypothetical protein